MPEASGNRWSGRLIELLWIAVLAAVAIAPNLFAVQQYRSTGGYLFYANAFDEPTYLAYDGALATSTTWRWSEHLIVRLHEAGLSGGYINLLFDLVVPVVTLVFVRRVFTLLGFSPLRGTVAALVMVAAPVLVGYANPYYARVYNLNYDSRGLSWLVLPQAYYPPFFRTPEPQLSLCLAAIAVAVSLWRRSLVPALVIAPLLYPFVSVPFAFVVLCLLFDRALGSRLDGRAPRALVAILAAFVAVSCAKLAYARLVLQGSGLADFLPATRWPLASGTAVAALVLYWAVRSRLAPALRRPALYVAAAPLAVVNTQLIAGFFEAPGNFEQTGGVVALGALLGLALSSVRRPWAPIGAAALSFGLLGLYASYIFDVNRSIWQRMPPPEALLDGLRRSPDALLIEDPLLADMFSLIAPRIHFTALAPSQTIRTERPVPGIRTTAERFEVYQCTKQLLAADQPLHPELASAFRQIDSRYRYLGQEFPLLHLNRRTSFVQWFDPSAAAGACAPRDFQVFPALLMEAAAVPPLLPQLTDAGRWERDGTTALVVTPGQRWAYAAQVPLPPEALAAGAARMAVRAELTVEHGCVGVGVLTHDQRAFVHEEFIDASGSRETREILFEPDGRGQWLVVRNCSADGPSRARLDAVALMAVRGATVRSLRAAIK